MKKHLLAFIFILFSFSLSVSPSIASTPQAQQQHKTKSKSVTGGTCQGGTCACVPNSNTQTICTECSPGNTCSTDCDCDAGRKCSSGECTGTAVQVLPTTSVCACTNKMQSVCNEANNPQGASVCGTSEYGINPQYNNCLCSYGRTCEVTNHSTFYCSGTGTPPPSQ